MHAWHIILCPSCSCRRWPLLLLWKQTTGLFPFSCKWNIAKTHFYILNLSSTVEEEKVAVTTDSWVLRINLWYKAFDERHFDGWLAANWYISRTRTKLLEEGLVHHGKLYGVQTTSQSTVSSSSPSYMFWLATDSGVHTWLGASHEQFDNLQ